MSIKAQEGRYVVTVECSNCGHRETEEYPKGTPVGTYPCGNCGCKALTRIS